MSLQQEQLIDQYDNSRAGKASFDIQQRIKEDPEALTEWKYLHLAVEGVQDAALAERIAKARSTWQTQQSAAENASPAIIRSVYRNMMRVAACLLLVVVGSSLYKYVTTSSSSIYGKYYMSYALNTNRGAGTADAIEEAYNNKDWTAVINAFNNTATKSNESYFLAGVADLELKKYADAINKFHQVMANNARTGNDSYQDESEYYLAMSWLANSEVKEAMPLLKKISADKHHLYHDKVTAISSLDLQIAAYKEFK